jgi:hypothetical protein
VNKNEPIQPAKEHAATSKPQRKPRLRLPFDNRKEDIGEWAFDHRVGLAVTLIVYLVIGIVFMAGKIAVGERQGVSTILVDLENLEALEQERDRLREEVEARLRDEDWRNVRNMASNENALNENLKDDRGTKTAQLNESAEAVQERMRANREAYEKGLAEAEKLSNTENGTRLAALGLFILCQIRTVINIKNWWLLNMKLQTSQTQEEALGLLDQIEALAHKEMANAKAAIPAVETDSRIGWEPSMEYVCDKWHLDWKQRQMEHTLREISVYRSIVENAYAK